VTVVKNDKSKALQNKKKPANKGTKLRIGAGGAGADPFADEDDAGNADYDFID
jgi:hypothetical protein